MGLIIIRGGGAMGDKNVLFLFFEEDILRDRLDFFLYFLFNNLIL